MYFLCLAKTSVELAVLIKSILLGAVPTDLFVKAEKVGVCWEWILEFGLPYNVIKYTLKYTLLKFHYKFYNCIVIIFVLVYIYYEERIKIIIAAYSHKMLLNLKTLK